MEVLVKLHQDCPLWINGGELEGFDYSLQVIMSCDFTLAIEISEGICIIQGFPFRVSMDQILDGAISDAEESNAFLKL